MKQRVPDKFWFPWWPDKWIFGSIRIECTPAERGIWVDLLSLASKDDGHIRANENTPYPLQQLAGMLIIPEEELGAAIKKFLKKPRGEEKGKLTKLKTGTLYVTEWEKYQFSERHKRRVEGEMSDKKDIVSKKKDPIIYNNKVKNSIKKNKNPLSAKEKTALKKKEEQEALWREDFEEFWKAYRDTKDDVGSKAEAWKAYLALVRKGVKKSEIIKAFWGEMAFLKYKRLNENFPQRRKYASTWLRSDRWKEHIDFKYEPNL
jgi:hypothetical protein